MKLYYGPGACSIGIHYLLEECGAPYEAQRVDLKSAENTQDWFAELNPKTKVPTLQRDDGSILTEFPVIARYIAEQNLSAGFLPSDPEVLLRASELTEFVVSTIHMQGFSRAFRPGKFNSDVTQHPAVVERGKEIIKDGFAQVERGIGPGGQLASQRTFADAALFYVLF